VAASRRVNGSKWATSKFDFRTLSRTAEIFLCDYEQFRRSYVVQDGTRECGTAMCDKCAELDEKIEHYRGLRPRITDPQTTEGLRKLIDDMQAQKAALHPEQEK